MNRQKINWELPIRDLENENLKPTLSQSLACANDGSILRVISWEWNGKTWIDVVDDYGFSAITKSFMVTN